MTTRNLKERLAQAEHLRDYAVELRKRSLVIPDPANPRSRQCDQIPRLKRSITEFGFTNPILVDENGVVICGHGRLQAATELAMELVPVIVIAGLSEAQRKALRIADNAIAEKSGWSKELLRSEIEWTCNGFVPVT